MRKHLSVFALCIRAKLWKLLLTLAAAAGISTAAFFILGLERAWGNGGGPGILALRILFVLSYIAVMITCFSPDTKRVKTCYFLQRLQISERAFLLWDALAAALCFLLFYCAQILTVFGLACVYQRSAGYALGPQGVFLMLARDSFLHGKGTCYHPGKSAITLMDLYAGTVFVNRWRKIVSLCHQTSR